MTRNAAIEDAKEIAAIYNYYIQNTTITFEEESVSTQQMRKRVNGIISSLPWIVYEADKHILGYAYASKWKNRSAYRETVESSVYLAADAIGHGIGSILYKELLNKLQNQKIHAVIGGIALPNEKSIQLHEKFGFKKVAHFPEVGLKFHRRIDVGYWELIL